MTCVLNAYEGNAEKIGPAVAECTRLDIPVLPPHINHSDVDFSIDSSASEKPSIRFGLASIKNVGALAIESLVQVRKKNGRFKSLADFSRRGGTDAANRRVIESLSKVGALDVFGQRGQLVASVDSITQLMPVSYTHLTLPTKA